MADTAFTRNEIVGLVIRLTLVSAVTYYSIKWLMSQVDPTNKSKRKAKERAEEQLKRCEARSRFGFCGEVWRQFLG